MGMYAPAFIAHQQRVTLREIPTPRCIFRHAHQTAIGVLGLARRDTFADDSGTRVAPYVYYHFCTRISLLPIVRDCHRVELSYRLVSLENARGIFPCYRRAGLDLSP